MNTLHDRLARLAEDAPSGGAPPAQLWARGTRTHRVRSAALVATLLVVVGSVGTGVGVPLIDGDDRRSGLASMGPVDIALPIEYPVGEELSDLGDTPGPLAAIWGSRVGGSALRAVGLVAATGKFGILPIDRFHEAGDPGAGGDLAIALSPDGRRIAYQTPTLQLVIRDLVSGQSISPTFGHQIRPGFTWIDATHLVGHVAAGSDVDGWVWQPGASPKRLDLRTYPGSPWLGPNAGKDPWFTIDVDEDGDRPCSAPPSPTLPGSEVPVLCDVLGVIGSQIVLTHWNAAVVALDRTDFPFQDPALRRVIVSAGAPQRVTFATDLIKEALDAAGGAS